ncbi:MAG: PadR family transcriptional regulator [Planctomycetota bacterium]
MVLRYVLLGCLEQPASGYDLKAAMDRSLSHLWAAESSQIYGTLRALEKEGLLASSLEKSEKGPDRRVYRRTTQGDAEFSAWLEGDPELSPERLSVLSQIHFLARERDPTQTAALLERVRDKFVERLRQYQAIQATEANRGHGASPDHDAVFGTLALDLGMKTLQARIEWCDEAIRRLTGLGGAEATRA